jgi:hypothetical protein
MSLFGIVGSIAGGLLGKKSADKAADAQAKAAEKQIAFQREMYEDTVNNLAPYREDGLDYNAALRYELLGGPRPSFSAGTRPAVTSFTETTQGQPVNTLASRNTTGARAPNPYGSYPTGNPDAGVRYRTVISGLGDGKQRYLQAQAPQHSIADGSPSPAARGSKSTVTKWRVGDKVFGSEQEARQYAASKATGAQKYQGFQQSPYFNYLMETGQQAVEGSAAARGGLYSGATMKALQEYGTNLGNMEYGNWLNRLTAQSGAGQNAAALQGGFSQGVANSVSNAYANQGDARAAGAVGGFNALSQGIDNAVGAWNYQKAQGVDPFEKIKGWFS